MTGDRGRIVIEGARARVEGADLAATLDRLGRGALVAALERRIAEGARRDGAALAPGEARAAAARVADRLIRAAREGSR